MGNVLVVDDEAGIRRVLSAALRAQGHVVIEADDGLSALEALRAQPCDLVITDWRMPRMSGDRLLAEVQRLAPSTDVIMMTGYGSIESAVAAMKAGAVDYMTKPLDLADVREKVALRLAERATRGGVEAVSPVGPLISLSKAITQSRSAADMMDGAMDVVESTFRPTALRMATYGGPLRARVVVAYRGQAALLADWALRPTATLEALAARPEPWAFLDASGHALPAGSVAGPGLVTPLTGESSVVGALTLLRAGDAPPYTWDEARALRFLAQETGRALEAAALTRRADAARDVRRARRSISLVLSRVIETYDAFTHEHSLRVAQHAERLAECAGLTPDEADDVRMASLLHDIGKLGVAMTTLHKPMGLTESEYDLVKLHPVMGARILAGLEILSDLVPLVLYHHEWVDGTGYPDGLCDGEIPLGARIIAVADTYDALAHDRPYRAGRGPEEAARLLSEAAGTQLDGGLVEAWVRCLDEDAAAAATSPDASP
ncbi:MAG: response regulator [Chloroflexi bacterium]|jgi:response regulator RpfG family c-di-GMP phosphodiesterase|nr:response regulator [Chloroflexota bacterium]